MFDSGSIDIIRIGKDWGKGAFVDIRRSLFNKGFT